MGKPFGKLNAAIWTLGVLAGLYLLGASAILLDRQPAETLGALPPAVSQFVFVIYKPIYRDVAPSLEKPQAD